jgi:hypothetical protein
VQSVEPCRKKKEKKKGKKDIGLSLMSKAIAIQLQQIP